MLVFRQIPILHNIGISGSIFLRELLSLEYITVDKPSINASVDIGIKCNILHFLLPIKPSLEYLQTQSSLTLI